MIVPENKARISLLRQYGKVPGLDIFEELNGCPQRYKSYIEGKREEKSYPLMYGTMIHEILWLAEEKEVPLLPNALEQCWNPQLPPEAYQEAVDDLTNFLDKGGLNLSMLCVEKELEMPLMEYKGEVYTFGGRIDWIGLNPEEPSVLYFVDYKSNRSPTSQNSLDLDLQMAAYGALIQANLSELILDMEPSKIMGILEQLKFNTLYTEITDERIEMFKSWASAMVRAIIDDEECKPVLNSWCGSCFRRFDCEEFKSLPDKGLELIASYSVNSTSLAERVGMMEKAKEVKRGLDNIIKAVKEELITIGGGVYDGFEYSPVTGWKKEYNLPALHDVLGVDFYNVIGVVEKDLSQYERRNLEKKSQIESLRQKVPGSLRLQIKKV